MAAGIARQIRSRIGIALSVLTDERAEPTAPEEEAESRVDDAAPACMHVYQQCMLYIENLRVCFITHNGTGQSVYTRLVPSYLARL
jgi:hypothetical protein